MNPDLPLRSVFTYIAIAAMMMVSVSFIFKNTTTDYRIDGFKETSGQSLITQPVTDLNEFEVKAIDLNKFSVSFYYNQEHDIFIKIYDVIGNVIHQEKVTQKGKFKKEYNLSGTKTEVYIVEVGNEKGSTTKRVFMS